MLEWLDKLKGTVTDAMAYDLLKANVESMQVAHDALKSHKEVLESRVADLESQLAAARTELCSKADRIAKLEQQMTEYLKREEFITSYGIAFRKGTKKGEYDKDYYCPECHTHLSTPPQKPLTCPKCGYQVQINPGFAYQAIPEVFAKHEREKKKFIEKALKKAAKALGDIIVMPITVGIVGKGCYCAHCWGTEGRLKEIAIDPYYSTSSTYECSGCGQVLNAPLEDIKAELLSPARR